MAPLERHGLTDPQAGCGQEPNAPAWTTVRAVVTALGVTLGELATAIDAEETAAP